jgi:hypothetical protein
MVAGGGGMGGGGGECFLKIIHIERKKRFPDQLRASFLQQQQFWETF